MWNLRVDYTRPYSFNLNFQLVEAYEEIFYIRRKMIRSNSGSTMYWAVQYIGRSEDAKRFLYKVMISRFLGKVYFKRCFVERVPVLSSSKVDI